MTPSTSLPTIPAVNIGDTALSLRDVLLREHHHGRLLPWLRRIALEAFLLDQARALGLKVEVGELKLAADMFRRRRGLRSDNQFQDWLRRRRLSAADIEAAQERMLLLGKLRRHVIKDRVAERFQADAAAYDRLRLRRILVASEQLAREVLNQLAEQGADFAAVARKYSRLPVQRVGRGGVMFRCQLPPPVREMLTSASPGAVVGPVRTPAGFEVLRVETVTPARLDRPTGAFIATRVFAEWLRERRKEAPLAAPLLDLITTP